MSAAPTKPSYARLGDSAFASMEKVNADLFTMTYGAFVIQLLKDYKDISVVNAELHKMGYNMGMRLIEEFLAKSGIPSCENFKDTAQAISKVAFKMFLGISAEVTKWSADNRTFFMTFRHNPLNEFVELPASCTGLEYSNVICGAITGALRMVRLNVTCEFVQDELKGSENEIKVTLVEILTEKLEGYEE